MTRPFEYHKDTLPWMPIGSTPDGVPLAGWWRRAFAWIVDALVIGAAGFMILPWLPGYFDNVDRWVRNLHQDLWPMPNYQQQFIGIDWAIVVYVCIIAGVALLYAFFMLTLCGATLGQLVRGIHVVPAEHGQHQGGLPAGTVMARVAMFIVVPTVISVLNQTFDFPIWVGYYVLADVLWAAFDRRRRQCRHDKVARTQVVRRAAPSTTTVA